MKIPKIPIGTPVQINWLDILTDPNWRSKAEFIAIEPVECILVGIWMNPGPKCIHIAGNINESGCDGTTIPIGCVIGIRVLKEGKTQYT